MGKSPSRDKFIAIKSLDFLTLVEYLPYNQMAKFASFVDFVLHSKHIQN